MYALEATFLVWYSWNLVWLFFLMKSCTILRMGHFGSKSRSLGQIIEGPTLVTKGLWFKSLLFNAKPHKAQRSGEQLQGHHGSLVARCHNPILVQKKNKWQYHIALLFKPPNKVMANITIDLVVFYASSTLYQWYLSNSSFINVLQWFHKYLAWALKCLAQGHFH